MRKITKKTIFIGIRTKFSHYKAGVLTGTQRIWIKVSEDWRAGQWVGKSILFAAAPSSLARSV
jgi:hypothetical protein